MSKTSMAYDKNLINREVVAVCDYYLTHRRGEGKRQTYQCPVCGDRNFEVDPVMGYAGCFDAACDAPTTTDALGIIAYFEGNSLSGEGFVLCLKKGYEILGLDDPEEGGENRPVPESSGGRAKAISPRDNSRKKRAISPRSGPNGQSYTEGTQEQAGDASGEYAGPKWGAAATADPASDGHTTGLEQPIQAWQENTDGSRSAIAAVVIHEEESNCVSGSAEYVEDADIATSQEHNPVAGAASQDHNSPVGDERQKAHEVFEALLKMCRLEERDERFLLERGLDEAAIEEGRFGSFSKDRCDYVLGKLDQRFSREDLLSVPGFYEAKSGALRFSLYGDYVLIPYLDNEGYIRTVEGRFTGQEMGEYDKRYKALLGSAVHLYVHPHYKPEEVVAICEGAIGAMVAARYGFAVAAIKGFRNYRARSGEDEAVYTVLPELSGVDFAGKVVVYIPDLDVKPKSYAEVMKVVPHACNWLIQRQGGIPKVAMLPEGAKDLDAWILSLDEEEREQKIEELLDEAMPVERFEEEYLDTEQQSSLSQNGSHQQPTNSPTKERIETSEVSSTDASATEVPAKQAPATDAAEEEVQPERSSNRQEIFGDSEPGGEQQHPGGVEDTGDGAEESQTVQSTPQEGEPEPTVSNRRQYSEESGTDSQTEGQDNQEQDEESEEGGEDTAEDNEPAPDEGEGRSREDHKEDDTKELKPVREESGYSPPPAAFEVSAKGEWALAMLIYIVATIFLTALITVTTAPYVGWLGLPAWWGVGPGAFIAIWVTAGFGKLRKRRKARSLRHHIEGPNV